MYTICSAYKLIDLFSHRYVPIGIGEFFSDRALLPVDHFPHRLIRQSVPQRPEEDVEERHTFGESMSPVRFT